MSKYISKSEIVTWVQKQVPTFTESDLPDGYIEFAEAKVDAELVNLHIKEIPTESDDYNFLKYATMSWVLNLLCKNGILTQTNGQLVQEQFSEVSRRFESAMPMFFFASGTSDPFLQLLPDETFRMMMYAFLRAYKQLLFLQEYGRTVAAPKMAFDRTSRGMDWNQDLQNIENADKLTGKYYRDWEDDDECF